MIFGDAAGSKSSHSLSLPHPLMIRRSFALLSSFWVH